MLSFGLKVRKYSLLVFLTREAWVSKSHRYKFIITFASKFKIAQITPLLKKPGLDKDTSGNYCPISNLNNISKFLEHPIIQQNHLHTSSSTNFNPFQSANCCYYSTESVLLLGLDNIYYFIDMGSSIVLTSLDLSAAFDMVDNSILLNWLQMSIVGSAQSWFKSYLSEQSQFVFIGRSKSQ